MSSRARLLEAPAIVETVATGKWRVMRHGGRRNDAWKLVRGVEYDFERDARAAYDYAVKAMRQGGVVLVTPDGRILASSYAPRLRSRW